MFSLEEEQKYGVRKCFVKKGEEKTPAYFHRWTEVAYVMPPALMRGGSPGGQKRDTFAIVEDLNGKVYECQVFQIEFVNTIGFPEEVLIKYEKEKTECLCT